MDMPEFSDFRRLFHKDKIGSWNFIAIHFLLGVLLYELSISSTLDSIEFCLRSLKLLPEDLKIRMMSTAQKAPYSF